jgi:hypothetical protein
MLTVVTVNVIMLSVVMLSVVSSLLNYVARPNVIKITTVIYAWNKIECLSVASLSLPSQMFVGKTRSLSQSGAPGKCFTKALLANIRLGWKGLAGLKTLAFYGHL